jgi:hypothetical protein
MAVSIKIIDWNPILVFAYDYWRLLKAQQHSLKHPHDANAHGNDLLRSSSLQEVIPGATLFEILAYDPYDLRLATQVFFSRCHYQKPNCMHLTITTVVPRQAVIDILLNHQHALSPLALGTVRPTR